MKNFKLTRAGIVTAEIFLFIVSVFLMFWIYDDHTILWKDIIDGGERDYGGMCWQHQGLAAMFWFFMLYMVVLLVWEIIAKSDDDYKAPFQKLLERFDIETGYHDSDKASYRSDRSHYQSPRDYSDGDEDTGDEIENKNNMKMNWKKIIWWGIAIFLAIVVFRFGRTVFTQSVDMFNTSKTYNYSYDQKVLEKEGFYDKLWKTYDQKEAIVDLNKETFIEVTKIIMENRKAGENVMWNWVKENQHIPYEEFSKFYSNLSDYITGQREGYFVIEKQCQHIARQHNTMIDTFPNNVYNRMLKLEEIEYEYGFLSDSTRNVFATQTENLK